MYGGKATHISSAICMLLCAFVWISLSLADFVFDVSTLDHHVEEI
jgi:hypothetical protein